MRSMGVVKEAVDDTAGAAQMVSQQKLQVSGTASSAVGYAVLGCQPSRIVGTRRLAAPAAAVLARDAVPVEPGQLWCAAYSSVMV